MGFLKRLFGGGWQAELEEAVFQDARAAFARFAAARGHEHITAFAACTVDDACPPYYTGATREAGFEVAHEPGPDGSHGWTADPADWCWADGQHAYQANRVNYPDGAGKRALDAMCRGLRRFAESGEFKGKLPRDRMALLLWVNDPGHPSWAEGYAAQLNPPAVAEWFKVANSYAGVEDEEDG